MSDTITESSAFTEARQAYRAATRAFFEALEAETRRVITAIAPEITGLGYSLEWNEDYELKASISVVEGKALTDEEMDTLTELVEPYLEWLAELDGLEAATDLPFDVVP